LLAAVGLDAAAISPQAANLPVHGGAEMVRHRIARWAAVGVILLTGCGETATDGSEAAEEVEPDEPEVDYADLRSGDLHLDLIITEQHYFAVWHAAWIVQPEIKSDVALEPESEWLVTYETTAPSAPRFTGSRHSFTVEVDDGGAVNFSGDGLEVEQHPIGAHPERIVLEVGDVIRR
jgi:hypothetical protein